VILVASILIFSNAFMEYATSGLENPLAYLLVALIFTLALNPKPTTTWAIASGGSVAGLFLTRMDLSLLIAPVIAIAVWYLRTHIKIAAIAFGAALIPVVI
jgi:arabinofuranosyltransferase